MWSYHSDDDIDDKGYVHDDDTHRFQIIVAIVNEALREVVQFQEPGFGDYIDDDSIRQNWVNIDPNFPKTKKGWYQTIWYVIDNDPADYRDLPTRTSKTLQTTTKNRTSYPSQSFANNR